MQVSFRKHNNLMDHYCLISRDQQTGGQKTVVRLHEVDLYQQIHHSQVVNFLSEIIAFHAWMRDCSLLSCDWMIQLLSNWFPPLPHNHSLYSVNYVYYTS